MNERPIVFSPRARERLEEIADHLYSKHLSSKFVIDYIQQFEDWLEKVLGTFPDSGTPMPDYGEGVRRVVYKKYCFLYRVQKSSIEILSVYRENLP